MCGIAGVRRFDGGLIDESLLRAMAGQLHHRGPDESAVSSEPGIGFAHTRLSIIDLAASHQPMTSSDGRWSVVFNGEIFNYRELRSALDYPFTTDGDTETLVAGLAGMGLDFVNSLRGQFAFAAFDNATGDLHLVRDRLGILPLYYAHTGRELTFGSEIKSILVAVPGRRTVDLASLNSYLAGRSVPSPDTMFDGVKKLEPASVATVRANGELVVRKYWSVPPIDETLTWTDAAAVETVGDAVREAVRAALVADVPVGSYLSGGVDSSLIAAVATKLRGGEPVHTFAAGFGDPRNDELPWARTVSEHLGTIHHEVHVQPEDFAGLWQTLTWHRDAPMSEPADTAVFKLAQFARRDVKVVLSGEGGDELFGGYPKYRAARLTDAASVIPHPLRSSIERLVDARLGAKNSRARVALRAVASRDEAERLQTWFAPFTAEERRRLLGPDAVLRSALPVPDGRDPVDRMLRFDLRAWLPDNLLERGDRMSMAASLELRPPLLDHRLTELAFSLPSRLKVRGRTTKWVLKEVAREYLPAEVVDRRKVGFRVPLDRWFREGLRETMRDRLTGSSSFVAEVFDRRMVTDLLLRHESGEFNEESRIWTLLSLEVWHETFIAKDPTQRSVAG